jgi:hypothetical protein
MISEWILLGGYFGETKDGLPYIGKHPNFRAYFVFGLWRNGITFSVIGMELVSEMLKNKKHPLAENFKFRIFNRNTLSILHKKKPFSGLFNFTLLVIFLFLISAIKLLGSMVIF